MTAGPHRHGLLRARAPRHRAYGRSLSNGFVFDDAIFMERDVRKSGALLGGLLFFAVAFGTGYLLGGPRAEDRRTLAIMTFPRNAPISIATASQVFPDNPGVLVMVTVLCALSPLLGVAVVLGFRRFSA